MSHSHESVGRVSGWVVAGGEAAVGKLHKVVLPEVNGGRPQRAVLHTPQTHVVTTTGHHPEGTEERDYLTLQMKWGILLIQGQL